MIKQCVVTALIAATGLTSLLTWAAREEHTFEVSLNIPSRAFYILPTDPDWIHSEQILLWNPATSKLGDLRKYFDVRHDTSAIEARLENQPYLSNGRPSENIALRVMFNGVELNQSLQQVVSVDEAAMGSRVLLEVVPQRPASGFQPGEYAGNVLLLFNAKMPGV